MFFRRHKPHIASFNERIDSAKKFGMSAQAEGSSRVRLSRDGIAAMVADMPGDRPHIDRAGLAVNAEIGALVNGGYQQFWLTPSKKRVPATAGQLKALHAFEEDLKEAFGLTSLYNTSLGTISALHLYDRVVDRDQETQVVRAWERAPAVIPDKAAQ